MKTNFTSLLLLLFISTQAQYTVDWSKAPLNPIPEQYTRNHFRLKEDVESFTDVFSKTTTTFDRQGKALMQKSETDQTFWVYDTLGHLNQQKWGETMEIAATYKTNELGFITEIIHEGNDIQTINYNEEGLFASKMEGDVPVVKYAYDDQGRVVQEEFFYNGVSNMLAVYEYKESPEGLTVKTTHINRNLNEMGSYTQKFNKRGDRILRDNKKQGYIYDIRDNILSSTGKDFPVKYEYTYLSDSKEKKKK